MISRAVLNTAPLPHPDTALPSPAALAAAANVTMVLQPGGRGQLFVTLQRCPLILSYILAQVGLRGGEQGCQSPTSILANRQWLWPCCTTSSHETPSYKVLSGSHPCAQHRGPESHNPQSPGHDPASPQQPQALVPVPTSVHAPEPWACPSLSLLPSSWTSPCPDEHPEPHYWAGLWAQETWQRPASPPRRRCCRL